MKCKLCIKNGQPKHFGSPRDCAFDGDFCENWNCSTIGLLRLAVAGEDGWGAETDTRQIKTFVREDQTTVLVDLLLMDWVYENDEEESPDSLFITWYKRRGRTEQVFLMYDNQAPDRPTELQVLEIVKYINSLEAYK